MHKQEIVMKKLLEKRAMIFTVVAIVFAIIISTVNSKGTDIILNITLLFMK